MHTFDFSIPAGTVTVTAANGQEAMRKMARYFGVLCDGVAAFDSEFSSLGIPAGAVHMVQTSELDPPPPPPPLVVDGEVVHHELATEAAGGSHEVAAERVEA